MSEGAQDYRATDGHPDAGATCDTIDDAFGRAYDELAERAAIVREHICLHPFHVDVSPEFLDDLRCFALAVDAFEAASQAVDHAAAAGDEPGWLTVALTPVYAAGFVAGAHEQHEAAVQHANARGWVKVASALRMMPVIEGPPAPFSPSSTLAAGSAASDVPVMEQSTTCAGGSDVRA